MFAVDVVTALHLDGGDGVDMNFTGKRSVWNAR